MSSFKTATLYCALAGLMFAASSAQAADFDLSLLEGSWKGQFKSDCDGYEGQLSAELKLGADGQLRGILPYIEQDNVYKFQVASADVNNDGVCELIAFMGTAGGDALYLRMETVMITSLKDGDQPMLVGNYEIVRVDLKGNSHIVDYGTFGIIAILIG